MSVTGSSLQVVAPNALTIKFVMFNRAGQYLVAGTGVVETYSAGNLSTYKIDATAVTGLDLHEAGIPAIVVLPEKFSVLALNDADDSIVGEGEVTLDSSNKHANNYITELPLEQQDVDGYDMIQALEFISAGVAGNLSGAGTGTEMFVGLDGATNRFTSTVTASGNRTISYAGAQAFRNSGPLRVGNASPRPLRID